MLERTLALIKPDAIYNNWSAAIIQRYKEAGLTPLASYRGKWHQNQAHEFYGEHAGKFYYAGLILAMTSGPTVALLLEGEKAIKMLRLLTGATDPAKAVGGTIRKDFLSAGGPFNTVHSSDSEKAAKREIALVGSWDSYFKRAAEKETETGSS